MTGPERVVVRLAVAIAIGIGLYGIAAGTGAVLFSAGVIGTGATHNDCADFRDVIARERGIDEKDVEQREIKRRTEECLARHEMSKREAFTGEYLFWAAWPAAICALVYLFWPSWARALQRQEAADEEARGGHREAELT